VTPLALLPLLPLALVAKLTACSSDTAGVGSMDGGGQDSAASSDASGQGDTARTDGAATDGGSDGGHPTVTGLAIATVSGMPLHAAAGDTVALKVVKMLSDGTTADLPAGTTVRWTAPTTLVARNPDDAGSTGGLPASGAVPTGVFVDNPYRSDHSSYSGVLFVLDPGTAPNGMLTVTASVADAGAVSASIGVDPTPPGDPDSGANLYGSLINCAMCHGATGGGSPPTTEADGSVDYVLMGGAYPYPAPALNDTSPGGMPALAADPGWNAALLGFACASNVDNQGVALRAPMPDITQTTLAGHSVGAKEFADIYAFLKTQTQ
jgi:mono/diheme cytochrome c family protein